MACQRLLAGALHAHAGWPTEPGSNAFGLRHAGTGEDRCVQRTLISAICDLEAGPAPGGGAGLESGSGSSASPPQSGSSDLRASAPVLLGAPASAAPLPAAPASIRLAPLPGPEPGLGPRPGLELGAHQASASAPALASLGPFGRMADALGADADGVCANPGTNHGATLAHRGGFFASLPDLRAEAEPPGPQPRPPPLPPTAHLLGGASGGLGPAVAAGGVPGSAEALPLPATPTVGGLVEPGAAATATAAAACEDGCAPSSIALRTLNTQVWLALLACVVSARLTWTPGSPTSRCD